jgi:hypothetical protein
MTGVDRSHVRLRVAFAAALAVSLAPFAAPAPAAAATDLLPDLKMSEPYNLRIERSRGGRTRLRFGTIVWNVGDGPLEVRASGRDGRVMYDVVQWIRTRGGAGHAYSPPGATAFYSGDGHNHWHIESFVVISLFPAPGSPQVAESDSAAVGGPTFRQRGLRKIGFCLTDLVRAPASLRPPGSERRIRYAVGGCGTQGDMSLRMGISVGYGDDYKPFFNHQWLDITGLPAGTYRLCATVNSNAMWREKGDNHANNSYWLDLELDAERRRLRAVDAGETDCEAPPRIVYGAGG